MSSKTKIDPHHIPQHRLVAFAERLGLQSADPDPGVAGTLTIAKGGRRRPIQQIVVPQAAMGHQIDLHRSAGLGDVISFVVTNKMMMMVSSNSQGICLLTQQPSFNPTASADGISFTLAKRQVFAIFGKAANSYRLQLKNQHVHVRTGNASYSLRLAPEPLLPHVEAKGVAVEGTLDPGRLSQLLKWSKPFLELKDNFSIIAIAPSNMTAVSRWSFFSGSASLGDLNVKLAPRLAAGVASAVRAFDRSARVVQRGKHIIVAGAGAALLFPKAPSVPEDLRPLEAPSQFRVSVSREKLMWPLLTVGAAVVGKEPVQVSATVANGMATLEFFYLDRNGRRTYQARATVEGLDIDDTPERDRYTAYVDHRQLVDAIAAADEAELVLEWVEPNILRLIHHINAVPVHIMLAAPAPDRNGALKTSYRR